MDIHIDKECSALGGLFQTIINDMKTQAPVWEDFISKAGKLHSTLRITIVAIGGFLEAFQRVADMATNTRGATREIGSALTRLCMRHRSIEQKLKIFTSSILDMCVNPLQERMEEWKKTVVQLDKDHAKEYKKARTDIKKASSDTLRLQKKVRKGSVPSILGKNDMQNKLDSALQEVNDKFMMLEETEKNAVRTALIEERNRFCLFISCLKPVVDEEIAMLTEITHLQEVIDALCMQAGDPYSLPPASEQVIRDLKLADGSSWSFQTPPSSPSSIGSRKSSMCSISSINSSSSGSTKSHSPSHHLRHRASSQILEVQLNTKQPLPGTIRLSSVSSQDSGFTSQDTLFLKNPTPPPLDLDTKNSVHEAGSGGSTGSDSNASTPSPSHYSGPPSTSASTWSNWPDPPHLQSRPDPIGLPPFDRPHTISTAYERHTRPSLTAQTFEPPDSNTVTERPTTTSQTAPSTPSLYAVPSLPGSQQQLQQQQQMQQQQMQQQIQQHMQQQMQQQRRESATASPYAVPCIVPQTRRDSRAEPMHRPPVPPPIVGPKPKVRPVAPPVVPDFNNTQPDQSKKKNVYLSTAIPQPVYVNMNELATMAVAKQKEVEEHRRQLQKQEDGGNDDIQDNGQQAKPPDQNPYARPSFARCQRSVSMPAQNQEGRELADAIKELEASTAALQMVYDGGTGGPPGPQAAPVPPPGPQLQHQPGARHSVAVPGYGPSTPDDNDGDGYPMAPGPGSTATLRRGSLPAKPPAPVRRTSSISGGMSGVLPGPQPSTERRERSGSKTPTPQGTPTRHRRTTSDMTAAPDRPPDPSSRHSFAAPSHMQGDSDDDSDDGSWPPPPPVDFMTPAEIQQQQQQAQLQSQQQQQAAMEGGRRGPRGSVTETHSELMQNLNSMFRTQTAQPQPTTGAQIWHPDSLPLTAPCGPAQAGTQYHQHERTFSTSSDDITPTAEAPPGDNLMNQIKRGVSLKRTTSNDRSAPRLPHTQR